MLGPWMPGRYLRLGNGGWAMSLIMAVIALAGLYLNTKGKWQGFALWLISNAYWAWHNAGIGEYAQTVLYSAFWLLSLYGLWTWRKYTKEMSERINKKMPWLNK